MEFDVQQIGPDLLIRSLSGRIDAAGAVQFKDQILSLVQDSAGRVMLDLSAVAFLDSSGLGALVAIRRMLGARSFELVSPTTPVMRVLRLTRMDMVFTIHHPAEIDTGDLPAYDA